MLLKESPLQGKNLGTDTSVSIREIPGVHSFDLRVATGTMTFSAIAEALGMELPQKPGSVWGVVESFALCLAPDWWLIVGSDETEKKLTGLRSGNDHHFSVVDVSGQRTTIELEGPYAREVLSRLWEQDLREKSFPIASVSQGLMAKAPVILWHIAQARYRVMVRSSFALHLWKALADAAEEWL